MYTRLLFLAAVVQLSLLSDPLVQLPNGYILGREAVTVQNTTYFAFEGIPYAAPPVGELRFKAPQPPQNWENTLNATHSNVACFQTSDVRLENESEDCLYLSIYTPKVSETVLLPVMVFIYGGGFIGGAGYFYKPDYLLDSGVILVTFNYRLGVFGFSSTEDEVIPGNSGLKDQALALKWVSANVEVFGGDPNKITIFGESAGSASVAYQLLNQDNEGLFRGAIMESGTFLGVWTLQRNARQVAYGTAAFLNDTIDENIDTQTLLGFLQSVDASDLNQASVQYYSSHSWSTLVSQGITWSPVIEVKNSEAFLTKSMYDLLKAGNFLQVPIIIGINSEETLTFNPDLDQTAKTATVIDENLDLLVPDDMQISDLVKRTEMGFLIRELYTSGENFSSHVGDLIRYASDNTFARSAIKHAELASTFVNTYFYQLSYDGELGNVTIHYDGAENVGHGEDLNYLFCFESGCSGDGVSEKDLLTKERMLKLWTNFAKYLNPTPEEDDLLQNVVWPEVSIEEGDFFYLDIGNNLEVKNHPKEITYKGWAELYESLGIDSFDTY